MMKMNFEKKNIDNESILAAAKKFSKGDPEAFNFLYKIYNKKIYRFCLRILNDSAAAKDAFQDTFLRIYEYHKSFDGINFQSWLYATARNTCITHIRKRKNNISINDMNFGFTPRKHTDIGIKEHIEEQVAKLPYAHREAFILRDMEDLTYQEIAYVLGIDLSLAKIRVHRARLRLKELLKPLVKELNETA